MTQLSELDFENIGQWPAYVRWGTLAFVVGMVLFLGYKIDINPQLKQLSIIEQELPTHKLEYKQAYQKLMQVKSFETEVKKMQNMFGRELKGLPRKFNITSLLDDITRVGQHTNLKIKLLDPEAEVKNRHYAYVPIDIIALGSYHQVAQFISELANLNQPIRFKGLRIKPDKKQLELDITAEVYRYRPYRESTT